MGLDSLLNDMEEEGNSLEQLEGYEMENYIMRNPNKFPGLAAKLERKRASKTPGLAKLGAGNQGNTPIAAAQFDIVITRNTNAIVGVALPFVVFGRNDAENGFRNTIPALPAGVVLTSVRYGENASRPNDCRFTYTSGANVDTIDVTCNQFPYPSFLTATQNDIFKLTKIRLSLTDTTATAQFAQPFDVRERSIFGTDKKNPLSVTAFRSPDQFQTGIIDINGEVNIDSETAIVSAMFQHTAAFSITFSSFVKKFAKYNANGF